MHRSITLWYNAQNGCQGGFRMITKRMVGIVLALLGSAIAIGTFAVDAVGAGKWQGLGPAQKLTLAVGLTVALVGLSLIPLGDRAA